MILNKGEVKKMVLAAVFYKKGRPLQLEEFELPSVLEPAAALCRITMSTICGSDLHTISGRRIEAAPLILGHEIVGELVALGEGLERDGFGHSLKVGDRVSWSIMASCGQCIYCNYGLPQKCQHLKKYGHTCINDGQPLTGGYAEYIYLFPGTAIFKIPTGMPDEIATPANCALSTVINAKEIIGFQQDETVLIQGAGLLGLNLVALARETGAKVIIVTDISEQRLDLAGRFGADLCLNLSELSEDLASRQIREAAGGHGVDVAFEVCGVKSAVKQALEVLRIGGRYLLTMVTPMNLELDVNNITRNYLTIKGIHNYNPHQLGEALSFLSDNAHKYPYEEIVGQSFPLSEIEQAIQLAKSGKHIRVGITPGG
jgi:putative phosphonate catabolism associated alcohol dehydrogenase